jgi:hypothetical protein
MARVPPALLLLPSLLMACGDKENADTATSDCDGQGEWNADHGHCHCDEGYALTADGAGCEPREDDGDDTGTPGGDAFDPDSVEGTLATLSDGSQAWLLLAKDDATWLSIENYPAYGGATGPERRTLDATEADYATCGVCLLLQTDCEPHGSHAHCGATFMPEPGGEVVFEALGDAAGARWTGSLNDVTFVEVEIGDDYETTPVEGGARFELEAWSFDVVLEAG